MNTFKQHGPGGLRGRDDRFGGRPAADADYGKNKSYGKKPMGGKGGFGAKGRGDAKGGFKGRERGGFGGPRSNERREVTMHKATCSSCDKACEVPFRPDGSKPVLCSECFGKSKSDDRGGFERRDRFSHDRPKRDADTPLAPRAPSPEILALQEQVASLEASVQEILTLLKAAAPIAKKPAVKKVAKKIAKKVVKKVAKKVTKKK